jgi:hypothetical protein
MIYSTTSISSPLDPPKPPASFGTGSYGFSAYGLQNRCFQRLLSQKLKFWENFSIKIYAALKKMAILTAASYIYGSKLEFCFNIQATIGH